MRGPRDDYSLRDIDRGPAKPLIQGDIATWCRQCKEDVVLIGRIRELGDGNKTITGDCPNCHVLLVRAYPPPSPKASLGEEYAKILGIMIQPIIDLIEDHPVRWILAGLAVAYLLGASMSRIFG
jgi:hypothetical protein